MPSATARDFQRVASQIGFIRRRQTGSHERWNHPDGRAVTIPMHGRSRDRTAPLLQDPPPTRPLPGGVRAPPITCAVVSRRDPLAGTKIKETNTHVLQPGMTFLFHVGLLAPDASVYVAL